MSFRAQRRGVKESMAIADHAVPVGGGAYVLTRGQISCLAGFEVSDLRHYLIQDLCYANGEV